MTDRWVAVFLISANVLLLAIMGSVVYFLSWSGPGFAAGCIVGATFFFTYFRIKHGYWP